MKEKANKKWWERIFEWVHNNEVLLGLLLLVVVLRIATVIEPNRYADEDIYLTLGMGLRRGLVFYRDIHDNKPPLLYLLAGLAGNVMYFRLILMAWNLVNVWLVWRLAEKLMKSRLAVAVAGVVFVIFSNIPLLEGNIANGEIFMIMPMTAGVLLLLMRSTALSYVLSGLLFAVGFLFKVPVAFDLVGIVIWLTVYQAKRVKEVAGRLVNRRAWLMIGGFLLPIVITIVYYYLVGAGERYLRSALGQNIGYLSSWEGGSGSILENGLFQRGMVLMGVSGLILLLRNMLGKGWGLVCLWMIFGLFGANLAGRPYPHYLLEIVPAGSLLVGLMIEEILSKKRGGEMVIKLGVGVLLLGLTAAAVVKYEYWYYKSIPYYRNSWEYLLGMKSREEYKQFFGEGVVRNEKVAEYIKQRTKSEDRIFVWGTEPTIYVLSERLPVGRYTAAYHILDFGGQKETMAAIAEVRPKYIVIMEYEKEFRELSGYVMAKYVKVLEEGEARVYRRILIN